MPARPELEILFPTNYSDSSYQAIPAVAQLAGSLNVRITLLHAYDPRSVNRHEAEEQLHSFFAEAAHYGNCRRVVAEGPALQAVQAYAEANPVDLLVVPETDRFGLPRLGHQSMRARLLKTVRVPLWTFGARVEHRGFAHPIRNIACRVKYTPAGMLHFKLAATLAERLDARLHLLDVVPSVDESTLLTPLYSGRPLQADAAVATIAEHAFFMKRAPEVHVATGSEGNEFRRLLRACEADLFFCGEGQAIRPTLWGPSIEKLIDSCGCPVVATDGAAVDYPGWTLSSQQSRRATTPTTPSILHRGSLSIGA